MSRQLKIVFFSIVLILAFLNKCGSDIGDSISLPKRVPKTVSPGTNSSNNLNSRESDRTIDRIKENQRKLEESTKRIKELEIPTLNCPVSYPSSGYSPYDAVYGSGIYHQTDNAIEVTAPIQRDIVFLLKDVNTGRMIRNEFIKSGAVFTLTKIPFGDYKFFYTYGSKWCEQATFKTYSNMGNFTSGYGISKSDDWIDFEFDRGYYGTYTLKLQMVSNGNLETEEASEDEI